MGEKSWLERVKEGLKMVFFEGCNVSAAAKCVCINRRTLKIYVDVYGGSIKTRSDLHGVQPLIDGRPPYLSEESLETLRLFVLSMDFNGFPLSRETLKVIMQRLAAKERGKKVEEVNPLSNKTIVKIVKEIEIPKRTVHESVAVDAMRASKANEKYLGNYFDVLESVCQ